MNKSALLDSLFQYLGYKPGILPRELSGALPGTVISTLVGAGAGKYLASPLLKRLYPELDEDRVEQMATRLGGMAGLLPGSYLMWKTYQGAGGPSGWFNGLQNLKPKVPDLPPMTPPKEASVNSRELDRPFSIFPDYTRSVSPTWTQPSIPLGTTQNTLDTAVASGTMGVYDAARISQIMQEARPQGSGLVSPASVARAAVSYGVGSLAGRALGAVANATFGSLTPGEQQNLALGGGIGNLLFDTLGRLAR